MKKAEHIDTDAEWEPLSRAIKRLDGEGPDAYQAFLAYARLHTKDRNIKNAARDSGYSILMCKECSHVHDWSQRASMVDAIRWQREFKERERLTSADNKQFIQANKELKMRGLRVSQSMLTVAENLLKKAELVDQVIETGFVITKDGKKVATTETINMKAKISDIPRMVDTAVKVSRLVQDLPTEIFEENIPIGADLSKLTTEQILAMREKNLTEIHASGGASKIENVSDLEQ